MVVVSAILLSLAVSYVWLSGHWFGRVVMFLALLLPLCAAGLRVPEANGTATTLMLLLLIAGGCAWIVASTPIRLQRRREQAGNTRQNPPLHPRIDPVRHWPWK